MGGPPAERMMRMTKHCTLCEHINILPHSAGCWLHTFMGDELGTDGKRAENCIYFDPVYLVDEPERIEEDD